MTVMSRIGVWVALGMAAASGKATVMNRYYVADMSDFGKKQGFYIDFENEAPDGQACGIDTLKAFIGVADGKSWRFSSLGGPFHVGQTVHITATISPTDSMFGMDGSTGHTGTGFEPGPGILKAASIPDWANGSATYRIVQRTLTISAGTKKSIFNFSASQLSPALALFERPLPLTTQFHVSSGQTVQIDAIVEIQSVPDPTAFKPLIDRFGQVIPAKFPGKIVSDAQLGIAFKADDQLLKSWGKRGDVDKFGGELGVSWAGKSSGFYTTTKRNGVWWLMTPLGNPVFYTGVCTAPSIEWDSTPVDGRRDLFEQLPPESGLEQSMWTHNVWGTQNTDYATIHGLNLLRRFGAKSFFTKATDECCRRVQGWGFSGFGKWCKVLPSMPVLPVIGVSDVPRIDRHFDVFDPEICARLKKSIASQIGKDVGNPYILGYSFGNEYDEIVTADEVRHILASKTTSPAKRAFIAFGMKLGKSALGPVGERPSFRVFWGANADRPMDDQALTAPDSDVNALRRFYASNYYQTLYRTFKSVDPNHLYFGFWIVPGWWVSDEDWNLIAPHVDVIGFDRYSDWPGIENLLSRYDKPVLLGEFSFPSWYGGARGFGRYGVYTESDAESGERYATLLGAAAKCTQCVGTMWFQYRDEPITGRGPAVDKSVTAGEHYAFGLIDACDLPKLDLVTRVRTANLNANSERLKITNK
jgi:hypothetical protein